MEFVTFIRNEKGIRILVCRLKKIHIQSILIEKDCGR